MRPLSVTVALRFDSGLTGVSIELETERLRPDVTDKQQNSSGSADYGMEAGQAGAGLNPINAAF